MDPSLEIKPRTVNRMFLHMVNLVEGSVEGILDRGGKCAIGKVKTKK